MAKQSFRKNQLVKVPAGTQWMRLRTREETEAWYSSSYSKGMNDAGETKLPPTTWAGTFEEDTMFVVTRGRVRLEAYGYVYAGRVEVVNPVNGELITFSRRYVQPLSVEE